MHAYIQAASPWLNEHLKRFLSSHRPNITFHDGPESFPPDAECTFQYCDGWELNENFAALNGAKQGLINAYPNSDALARKNYLSKVVEYWTAKRPESILSTHSPLTTRLSLDYAEYVDDALAAADDLTLLYSLEENEGKSAEAREWWILKPALVDCGAGIRLFSTMDELASHLESVEDEVETDDDDHDNDFAAPATPENTKVDEPTDVSLTLPGLDALDALVTTTSALKLDAASQASAVRPKKQAYVFKAGGRIPSSEMREFVAQRYITAIPPVEGRKWHVRAYVLCIGRLKVFVFREMLALLASLKYEPPWKSPSLQSSLTNTALQNEEDFVSLESMRDFWALPDDLLPDGSDGRGWKEDVFRQICEASSEIVRAAAHTMADRFTTLDKCFELFGVDFLVDADGCAWLLEVNETPAFYQQGPAGPLSLRLMESVVNVAMVHMGVTDAEDPKHLAGREGMTLVLDETEKLAKSNITEIMAEG